MEREQFTFYRSYWKALSVLSKKDRLTLYEAIIQYGLNGTEPEGLTNKQASIFAMALPSLRSGRRKAIKAVRRQFEAEARELMIHTGDAQEQGIEQDKV